MPYNILSPGHNEEDNENDAGFSLEGSETMLRLITKLSFFHLKSTTCEAWEFKYRKCSSCGLHDEIILNKLSLPNNVPLNLSRPIYQNISTQDLPTFVLDQHAL